MHDSQTSSDSLVATLFPARTADGQARQRALAVYAGYECAPSAVVEFTSSGKLLLVGTAERAISACRELPDEVLKQCMVLATGSVPEVASLTPEHAAIVKQLGTRFEAVAQIELAGYLGRFQCDWTKTGSEKLSHHVFDTVLDLSVPPLIDVEVAPLGYFAPRNNTDALQQALASIPELVGTFEKPQFFRYDPSICAHGRSGIAACRRCLDTCPTQAITSLGEQIGVDANLCQGAGSCATACPSGAITYNYPNLADTLTRLRRMLAAYFDAGGEQASVLFHDRGAGQTAVSDIASRLPESVIPYELEELGSAGMDVWLAALAYGARSVWLLSTDDTPVSVVRELDTQLGHAHAILEGMGYSAARLQRVDLAHLLESMAVPSAADPITPAATFAGLDEKRTMIRLAVDHLYKHAPAPRGMISLPTGAPFGEASVDAGRCTLCMACVNQCPGKALQAGGELPQLKFIEANCIQCGLCCRTCPEDAISISPRYLYESEQRRRVRVLHEEAPFACIVCGKPFATQSVISRITNQLQGHPMFQGEALKRLKMCEDCRTRAIFEAENTHDEVVPEEES